MTTDTAAASAVARELHGQLPAGRVLSGRSCEQSRRIWNGAVDHVPAVMVRPETPREVQAAVLAARHHDLPLSVRGGGHDWAGRSLRHDGLVIDLSQMRQVDIDPLVRVATLQGGATAGEVITAAQPHGLAAATGSTGGVGMAGLSLGGGYGPLNGRFGLALDNVLSAEVVLADGQRVTADPGYEPELYWALRGGGGNFGVVTSLRVRLHPVPEVLAGFIVYPWAQAAHVWMRLNEMLVDGPDELTVQTGILSGSDGPTLFLSPVWSGEQAPGASVIDDLVSRLGSPLSSQVAPRTYADMLGLFDAQIVTGRHYAMRTRTIATYTTDVIAELIKAGDSQTSLFSGVFIHHFHGAATRVPLDATAFGIRRRHYVVEILAAWEPDDDPARHLAWADGVCANLAGHALPGGYVNLLGRDDHEQIAHAYGPNAARLRAVKKRFDPTGAFSAIPLPPETQLGVSEDCRSVCT
jgi:FAD/FMN-containing dehydrogenase